MSVPSIDDVKLALAPHHDAIRGVIEEAWSEWREVQAFRAEKGYTPVLYHRTASNYVFDAIARRAIPLFGANSSVRVEIEAQTFKLFIKGILVRFKKGGEDKLGCNIPTLSALLFQDADGQLPGFPPETGKVEVIWLPNEIWTQLDRVLVVARDGDHLIWEYEIDSAKGAGEGTVVPFKSPLDGAPDHETGDLIKPKAKPTEKPKKQ